MRAKHILILATAAAASLSSCTSDEYVLSANEEYTRNFIEEFGLIDPAQDWNLAKNTNVTVNVGGKPAYVKAYMKVDGVYYLVADLPNVSGTVKVPFDMPEGTRDIMVKINNKRYYTTPGGTVNPAAGSRALLNEGTNTFADVKVTVEENKHGRVLTLTPETSKEAINTLPESDKGAPPFSETNIDNVTDNFFVTAKEFYIFPEYWKSDSYSKNIIGVYWYVDPDTEGAEKIITKKLGYSGETEEENWIIRVPFFQNPRDFFTPFDEDGKEMSFCTDEKHWNSSFVCDADYYESKGIHVVFNKVISFGFYLQNDINIMYSEAKLNEQVWFEDIDEHYYRPSYAATFTNGTDTEGNVKRHLCFEDWYKGNWDLNDMVFRVYGFDALSQSNQTFTVGSLMDIDTGMASGAGEIIGGGETGGDGDGDGDGDEQDPTPVVDAPYFWLLAVEDLGNTDDFDFNDIVIGITAINGVYNEFPEDATVIGQPVKGAHQMSGDGESIDGDLYTKVTFTALAAGGTRKAYVYFNDQLLRPDGRTNAEWHSWFGDGNISHETMINTNATGGVNNVQGATCTIYMGSTDGTVENFIFTVEHLGIKDRDSADALNSGFKIGIDASDNIDQSAISADYFTKGEDGYFVKPSNPGDAPQMFLIPDRWNKNGENGGTSTFDTSMWKWPAERSHIANSYPGFANWVSDPEGAADWYKADGINVCRPTK